MRACHGIRHRCCRDGHVRHDATSMLTGIGAITLATHDMDRAVAFYQALGFVLEFGGPDARFTSFQVGSGYLNLIQCRRSASGAGGAARSSMLTTSTRSMRALYPPASGPSSPRTMDHGASGISTSSIRMDTNSALRGRSEALPSSNRRADTPRTSGPRGLASSKCSRVSASPSRSLDRAHPAASARPGIGAGRAEAGRPPLRQQQARRAGPT